MGSHLILILQRSHIQYLFKNIRLTYFCYPVIKHSIILFLNVKFSRVLRNREKFKYFLLCEARYLRQVLINSWEIILLGRFSGPLVELLLMWEHFFSFEFFKMLLINTRTYHSLSITRKTILYLITTGRNIYYISLATEQFCHFSVILL